MAVEVVILLASPALGGTSRRTPGQGHGQQRGRLVYGADLASACFGVVLSGAFLVSILGLPQTGYEVALLALPGLTLLLL